MNYELSNKWVSIVDEKIDIMNCINEFDKGFDRIYVVDSENNFNGMIIDKKNFCNVWKNSDNNDWYSFLNFDEIITDISNDNVFNNQVEHIVETTDVNEIPIVMNNKIEAIVELKPRLESYEYNWEMSISLLTVDYLTKNKCICLSSLVTQNSKNFYNKYISLANIVILNEANVDFLVNGEIDLFIYEEDVYQNLDINKISLKEIYSKFLNDYKEYRLHELHIAQDWAALNVNSCVIEFIKLFDKGYNSIYLEDDDKNFVATVCRHNFKDDLLQSNFRRWSNLFVEYTSDSQCLNNELISKYVGKAIQDIPIIKDKKVIASCCRKEYDYYPNIQLKWEFISISAVKKYFSNRKILLSSCTGELKAFYYKFKDFINLELLGDTSLPRYFAGEFDVVINKSDIWCNNKCISLDIYQLYLDLLGEYVANYLQEKQVDFYYFETIHNCNEILNWGKRFYDGHITTVISVKELMCKKQGDTYNYNDFDSEQCHIKNGIRRTVGIPLYSKNNICFYGACTSMGLHVSDEHTIESKLQLIINKENIPYSVVNAGGMFGTDIQRDINSLYLILNEKYNSGDIVIQIGFHMWNSELGSKIPNINYYRLAEVYNKREYSYSRIFMDWSAHLTADGNELVAHYIYQILRPKMIKDNDKKIKEK